MSKFDPNRAIRRSETVGQKACRPLLGIGLLVLVVLCLSVFFAFPLPNSSAPRWALLLEPTINSEFINEIWFGVDLPRAPFTGERFIAFAFGLLFVVSSTFLGLFFSPLIKSTFKSNCLETAIFATGLGLTLRSCIFLWLGLIGHARVPTFQCSVGIFIAFALFSFFFCKGEKSRKNMSNVPVFRFSSWTDVKRFFSSAAQTPTDKFYLCVQLILFALFSSFYAFSATQPIFEYDAVEYHVQSAREIFETGRIVFSPNNVYSNMPLGVETFYVAGFNMAQNLGFGQDDVLRIGSLIGKTILTSFVFLTALALLAFGLRFFRSGAGSMWAAIVFLSFPGVFEVFVSGLNDGVLCFTLFATLYLLFVRAQNLSHAQNGTSTTFDTISHAVLLGFFAGFAMGIKYTGVVFVVIPACVLEFLIERFPQRYKFLFGENRTRDSQNDRVIANVGDARNPENTQEQLRSFKQTLRRGRRRNLALIAVVFVLTVLLVSGGWYLRNAIAAGNPTYPLAYSLFGDKSGTWNNDINVRWKNAHSSSSFGIKAMGTALSVSLWKDGFSSPFFLFYGVLGVVALGVVLRSSFSKNKLGTEKLLICVWVLVLLFWGCWFFTTHRLARFLLPVLPLVATFVGSLIAAGLTFPSRVVKATVFVATLTCLLYSGLMIDMLGQGRMAPLRALERDPFRFTKESIYFNEHPELFETSVSSDTSLKKLLLIGEAKAFMYRVPILYSTCWNDSPLIPLLDGFVKKNDKGQIVDVTDPHKLCANLRKAGIEFILVDFSELSRFRSPGNYGFNNPEIDENLFTLLLKADVIVPYKAPELQDGDSNDVMIFSVCSPIDN